MSHTADGPADMSARRGTTLPRVRWTPTTTIGVGVLLLLVISQVAISSSFFSFASLSTLTPLVGIMVIVAIGQSFVIGTGGIDLSIPATIALVGSIVLKQSAEQSGNLAGALIVCAVVCIVIGLLNGLLIEGLGLNALVVTLAVGQLVAGATRLYRGEVLTYTNVPENLASAAGADIGGVSYILIAAFTVALLATFFLYRAVPGRRLVASSASARAALLAGLRARPYRVLAYVVASLAYGLGGVLAAGQIGTPDLSLGDPYLIASVVAVVLGGAAVTGGRVSPIATLFGAVFITVLDYDLRIQGLSAGLRLMVQGAVLVLVLSAAYFLRNNRVIRRLVFRSRSGADAVVN